jgi:arylformamidase
MTSLTVPALESLSIPSGFDRILFHTRNSQLWEKEYSTFSTEYVAIPEDGAKWLVSRGFRLVGIDYLSVAPYKNGTPTHRELLSAGVVVVEGLDLRGIRPGIYQMICLPLRIVGIDGAPARAILIDESKC